jgi:dihydropteroate synthase
MEHKNTFFSRKLTIKCRGEVVDLSVPKVMGVLNLTPDSFYDGGRYDTKEKIFIHVQKMVNEGCDILDIGACSTRPGAVEVSESEELKRLKPVIELIRLKFPELIISIDTYRSEIARIMVNDYSADLINDISAGDMDAKMLETIAQLNVPYIMMHMQGTPGNMQQNPEYKNVVQEVIQYFSEKINITKLLGINDVIIDPGFGFGKTIDHNYQLLKFLSDFRIFELPILVGLSRKSMIYKVLDTSPDDSLNGTTVLNSLAMAGGANILRVHDVCEAKEAIRLFQKFSNATVENWHD